VGARKKSLRDLAQWHWNGGPSFCVTCGDERECGSRCPYQANAPATSEGAAVWRALTTVASMVRRSEMDGRVVGLDWPLALRLCEVRGVDPATVAELLPAAEIGLLTPLPDPDQPGVSD
jgi:hypothetical protein